MGRCRCVGHVVFMRDVTPAPGSVRMWCRACGRRWWDVGERCTIGILSDVLVPWCPGCGSIQVTPIVSERVK